MIKLLVSDVDGTLLDNKSALAPEVIEAVRQLRQEGVAFAIASGRNIEAIEPISQALGGGIAALALNGGQIFDAEGRMIRQLTLPESAVAPVLEVAAAFRCFTAVFFPEGVFTPDPMDLALEKMSEGYVPLCGLTYDRARLVCTRVLEDCQVQTLPEDFDWSAHAFLKTRFVFSRKEDCLAAVEKFRDMPGVSLFPTDYDLEVTPLGADKGPAALALGELMGIAPHEIAAMGDSSNDRSMLRTFACSFALGNADPETKACATYTVADNDHAGAAEAIGRILRQNRK